MKLKSGSLKSTTISYLLTLLDVRINALRIALEVAQNRSDFFHLHSVTLSLSFSELFNQRTLYFVILLRDLLLSHAKLAGWKLLGN